MALRPTKTRTAGATPTSDLAECTALASKPISDLSLPLLRGLSLVPLQPGALAALTAGSFDKRLGMR